MTVLKGGLLSHEVAEQWATESKDGSVVGAVRISRYFAKLTAIPQLSYSYSFGGFCHFYFLTDLVNLHFFPTTTEREDSVPGIFPTPLCMNIYIYEYMFL